MVFAKVTDGNETRKLSFEEGITFEDFKKRIAELFPSLNRQGADFQLQYRDEDGDIIALSSDQELHAAVAHLPTNGVLRLMALPVATYRPGLARRGSGQTAPFGSYGRTITSPFDSLFEQMSSNPFLSPFGGFSLQESRDREWEERLRRREEETQREIERTRRLHEEHSKRFEEQRKKAEQEIQQKLLAQKESKQVQKKEGGDEVVDPGSNWHCQTFGSWDPVTYDSPYGRRTVIGPVGYHMYWGYSDPELMQTEEGEDKPAEAEAEAKPPTEEQA